MYHVNWTEEPVHDDWSAGVDPDVMQEVHEAMQHEINRAFGVPLYILTGAPAPAKTFKKIRA